MLAIRTAFAFSILFGPAVAQACCDDGRWSSRITFENDLFGGSDQYYTNSVRVDAVAPPGKVPGFLAGMREGAYPVLQASYFLAQYIYTATDIVEPDPAADDRPYAGWLHVGAQVAQANSALTVQDTLAVSLGVIGPSSRAEEAQNIVHRWRHLDEAEGWGTQMRDEPTLDVSFERRWRRVIRERVADAIPHVGANVGTTFRQARGGGMLRMGYNVPRDLGISPTSPTVTLQRLAAANGRVGCCSDFSLYLFADFEGRAVEHNTFLDGAPFRDSRSVDKEPLILEERYGVVTQCASTLSIAYIFVKRSREFEGQQRPQSYGSVQLVVPLWK